MIRKQETLSTRLMALDVFRGLAIAGMIVVNMASVAAPNVYPVLQHAEWHGCTPADLVFPCFLFIVGVAMAFSLSKYLDGTKPIAFAYWRVLRRAVLLFAIGVLLNLFGNSLSTVRILGVLQRISLAYLLAALAVLHLSRKGQWRLTIGLLISYWFAMTLIPVSGHGSGILTIDGNLSGYLDRLIISEAHLYQWDGFNAMGDPEGLLSTLPAVVSVLAGYFTGDWIRRQPVRSKTSTGLALASIGCLIIGLLWNWVFPINKKLWTSSYVLYTTGWALLLFAICYELIEVRRVRWWSKPLEVLGLNAIALFIASVALLKFLVKLSIGNGETATTAYNWIYQHGFAAWAGAVNGSLLFAIATLVLWWAIAYVFYRQRWLIRL